MDYLTTPHTDKGKGMAITSPAGVRIGLVGLGYVGLPLALALSRHYPVTGFDVGERRVSELKAGHDRTGEITDFRAPAGSLRFVDDPAAIAGSNVFIIAVPTPVDADNRPDLSALISACRTVGKVLERDAVVVFESTVYPGVTEEICGPELERVSGLACGSDFYLGYSPERINPGDREHTIDRITKVVAGQTPDVAALLAELYGAVTSGGTFVAKDIKTAEAAKVIENAQRDINIAFINEVTQIFGRLDISMLDVLKAASTKWNFLAFAPGLVGGHCIGVDPFYLAHCAQEAGHHPEIILAGRRINDGMGGYVAASIAETLTGAVAPEGSARVLVLGLTFKENVPDLRNSKVVDVIEHLKGRGHAVHVHDPLAHAEEARQLYGIDLCSSLEDVSGFDCLIGAVAHTEYRAFVPEDFARLVRPGGIVADIKGIWRDVALPEGLRRWHL